MALPSLNALSTLAICHDTPPNSSTSSPLALEPTPLPDAHHDALNAKEPHINYDLRKLPSYLADRLGTSSRFSCGEISSKEDLPMGAVNPGTSRSVGQTTPVVNVQATNLEPTQLNDDVNHAALTPQQKRIGLVHFMAVCLSYYLIGWNDGTTGPLLPRMQEQYQVGFVVVSLVFVGNCFGYVCAAALNVWFNQKFGFGKTLTLGAACQLVGCVIIAPAPPFPVLVCAYAIAGFGLSLQVAQANGFVGSLQNNMATKMGLLHGFYGLGAFSAPFASTYFSAFLNHKWAYHFIITAALSLLNTIILLWVFRLRRQEDILRDAGQHYKSDNSSISQAGGSTYRQIFRHKAVPLMIGFALVYIGVEVTLGGYIVTYIIRERHGGHNSGYISSGFFGGLTLGRVCLMWLNKLVGEYRIIFVYAAIAIAFEFTIWFVPSIIENVVAISLVGLVLGPVSPLLSQHMSYILPKWLFTGSVGLVAGVGVAGSAALPFITGLLASKFGIGSLQPLMISMMGTMLLVWAFVPKSRRMD